LDQTYDVPEGYCYTKEHEWISPRGSIYLVGITDYAAKMLNDIVYVTLPDVGSSLHSGEVFGQVESVKTVSDVYMPVSGRILKTNLNLTKTPELVAKSPYSQGWMLEIESNTFSQESGSLLNAKAYLEFISSLQSQ
jgi:glycine cleavage system H protein